MSAVPIVGTALSVGTVHAAVYRPAFSMGNQPHRTLVLGKQAQCVTDLPSQQAALVKLPEQSLRVLLWYTSRTPIPNQLVRLFIRGPHKAKFNEENEEALQEARDIKFRSLC